MGLNLQPAPAYEYERMVDQHLFGEVFPNSQRVAAAADRLSAERRREQIAAPGGGQAGGVAERQFRRILGVEQRAADHRCRAQPGQADHGGGRSARRAAQSLSSPRKPRRRFPMDRHAGRSRRLRGAWSAGTGGKSNHGGALADGVQHPQFAGAARVSAADVGGRRRARAFSIGGVTAALRAEFAKLFGNAVHAIRDRGDVGGGQDLALARRGDQAGGLAGRTARAPARPDQTGDHPRDHRKYAGRSLGGAGAGGVARVRLRHRRARSGDPAGGHRAVRHQPSADGESAAPEARAARADGQAGFGRAERSQLDRQRLQHAERGGIVSGRRAADEPHVRQQPRAPAQPGEAGGGFPRKRRLSAAAPTAAAGGGDQHTFRRSGRLSGSAQALADQRLQPVAGGGARAQHAGDLADQPRKRGAAAAKRGVRSDDGVSAGRGRYRRRRSGQRAHHPHPDHRAGAALPDRP